MALVLADRVLETTSVAGTGDAALDGAQTGFQPFSVIGNGSTTYYTIVGVDANHQPTGEWEVGVGTYVSAGNYISRDTVLSSSNGGAKVYFASGTKDIFLDLPSEEVLLSAGDVTGPASAVANNFAAFNMTTGKLIKDSGYNASSFATAAQGAKADTAVQPGSLGSAAYLTAGAALGVATLDAGGKVPTSQIPQMGDLNYQGTWNASTNTPTLTSSAGTKGFYYVVSVAGSTNLNGITDWKVGDWAVFNGSVWEKIDNTDAVTSVNGYTGTVVLTTTDIAEGTNEYFTTAKARASVSAGTGISYDSGTGVITNASPSLGGDVVGPASATDNAVARYDTTTGKLIQNSVVTISDAGAIAGATTITDLNYLDFNTAYATTLGVGQLGWDGNDTLAIGMAGGNVVQHIGEDLYFYCKATSAITKGQVVMFTGAVGASGVPTGAPATGINDGTYIMGIAAEDIALNGFGLVQSFGELRNVNTSGYADGDILWYNPAVAGGLTKTKPVAPNVKVQMAAVINGGSSGGGTILIRIDAGSTLGGTDSNAEIVSPTGAQLLTYDQTSAYWKNTNLAAGTGISVGNATNGVITITNSAPDQTVAITGAGGAVVTGTYPNFTITTPSGTVTSVTGTAPIASTGGATPAISISQATTSTDGYLSSTDWNTFNSKAPATSGTSILYGNGSGGFSNVTVGSGLSFSAGTLSAASSSGTVTSVSVVSANGFAGTVATSTSTPAISLSTTVTGIIKGNGTAISAAIAADFPTLNQNTTGTASNVTGTVAIINGGTGETTRQAAMDALAGATTSGQYLRGNGTDVVMSTIQAGDVPTLNQNTTGTAGSISGFNNPTAAATGNTIGYRDPNGYFFATYFNQSSGNTENPAVSQVMVTNGSDNYLRKASIAHLTSSLSGTAPINISGTSGSAAVRSATAQSASGTAVQFLSIPSGVKRITVMFSAVSTNGSSLVQVQIGSGGFTTSGYVSVSATDASKNTSTTGMLAITNGNASNSIYGSLVFTNVNSNTWVADGVTTRGVVEQNAFIAGGVTIGGTLDRLRVTTVNGTDSFDAGTINILFE